MNFSEKNNVYLYKLLHKFNNLINPKYIIKNYFFNLKSKTLFSDKKVILNQMKNKKKAVVYCYGDFNSILMQSFHIQALNQLGYTITGLLDNYNLSVQNLYRKFGVDNFEYLSPLLFAKFNENKYKFDLDDIKTVKELVYRKVSIGKLALSTTMRSLKKSRFNKEEFSVLTKNIFFSYKAVDISFFLLNKIKPDIIIFLDRGYSPEAELFESAIQSNIDSIEIHLSHRSEFLTFKRYNKNNKLEHFNSLSKKTLKNTMHQTLKVNEKNSFFKELEFCYNSGKWYEEVGTQYNKVFISKEDFHETFKLNKKLKTAVIFSHIFWDGTFFYGNDLFLDYEDWFKETVKIMLKNKKINWIIKVHPANKVKDSRDNKSNFSEYNAIMKLVKKLPENIKFINSDHKISTLSYFNNIDYCLTVRGTVGIEAACYGVAVITAGSGRYDGLGFTKDHKTRHEYLETIKNLHNLKIDIKKIKRLAIKFAYNLYVSRTFPTDNIKFYFKKNSNNTMTHDLVDDGSNEIFDKSNIKKLKRWFLSNEEDYLESKRYDYD